MIIVNSVYQLFTALHIRTYTSAGEADRTSCSRIFCRGRRIIHSDYRKSRLFERILYAKTAKLCRQYVSGEAEKIKEGYEKTDSIFRWILNDEPADYEAVYFANFDNLFPDAGLPRLYERHPQFIWYEDGFSSLCDRLPQRRQSDGQPDRRREKDR